MIRRTEQIAVEDLYGTGEDRPGYLNRLLQLTSDEPTTSELEEALELIEKSIVPTLRAWVSSRHLITSQGVRAIQFRQAHPEVAAQMEGLRHIAATPFEAYNEAVLASIPVATFSEDEALDVVEQHQAHPVFTPLLTAVRPIELKEKTS